VKRAAVSSVALAGCARAPSLFSTHGPVADREAWLGRGMLTIAALVVVAVGCLLLVAIFRRRPGGDDPELHRERGGTGWILIGGVLVPTLILVGVLIAGTRVLAAVTRAPGHPAATVQVVGHQWWWEVRYLGAGPDQLATTANEIHLPLGRPVRVELTTGDVIHSFWIPQLAGKMDLIPGQRNTMWLRADSAGTYWGHCAEYCGAEHAGMALTVVAESPREFASWLAAQRMPAVQPAGAAAVGEQVFTGSACALCHTIRGTGAGGAIGPDLTHLAGRRTLAAGLLPNTPGNLAGWIANPQAIKPGTIMPVVPLQPDQLHNLVAYLSSLR
jgi:cytochrome c oxidase subunit 2